MTIDLDPRLTTSHDQAAPTRHSRQGWTRAGLLGGVAGLAALLVSSSLSSDTTLATDNTKLVPTLAGKGPTIWISQVLFVAAAAGLVIFAAGLRRRLREHEPVGSLVPTIASTGLLLTAAATLIGGGLCTELYWDLANIQKVDPQTIAAMLPFLNTIGWLWAGIGLASASLVVAAKHGSVCRAEGRFSLVITVLIGATQLVPLQYLAGFVGPLWLIVTAVVMGRQERTA